MAVGDAPVFHRPGPNHPLLGEIVRRLTEAYHPERIYLFGSAARGDAGPDSDLDIMVVVADDSPPELLHPRVACQVLRGVGFATDVLVWRRQDFDKRLHLKASLPATIEREGRLLYAA